MEPKFKTGDVVVYYRSPEAVKALGISPTQRAMVAEIRTINEKPLYVLKLLCFACGNTYAWESELSPVEENDET